MNTGFIYDRENHKGYFNNEIIPSVTQLVAIRHPIVGVKQDKLDKACVYGTSVHTDCEMAINGLKDAETLEGKNFINIFNTLGFEPVETEKQVLFFNDYHEVVAYGTYDGLFRATKYVIYDAVAKKVMAVDQVDENSTVLIKKGAIVLYDIKTSSQFDNEKIALQTNIYVLGETEYHVDNIVGLWLRETTAQIRFLDLNNLDDTQDTFNELLKEWKAQQNETNI